MSNPRLVSIQVGRPQTYTGAFADGGPQSWTTAFVKEPVAGPVLVHATQIAGDAQVDLENHGGPDKAVLAYSADHYPLWRTELTEPDMPHGGFGENLTIAGLDENSVCLGDVWTIGPVRLEISQPRQPCWKLARRWNRPWLLKQVIETGRTGWYLRVFKPGTISPELPVVLEDRPHPEWTIARANRVMYDKRSSLDDLEELGHLLVLADSWRSVFAGRAVRRRIAMDLKESS
ncbi:MAG: MOSC domain-containing protein [Planctomycetaceae bacterium]|nr:MOSC domain-containing protein [Planctomycetaceae bacterium]